MKLQSELHNVLHQLRAAHVCQGRSSCIARQLIGPLCCRSIPNHVKLQPLMQAHCAGHKASLLAVLAAHRMPALKPPVRLQACWLVPPASPKSKVSTPPDAPCAAAHWLQH